MSLYIKSTSKGAINNPRAVIKLAALINDGAIPIKKPKVWKEGIICLTDNIPSSIVEYANSELALNTIKDKHKGKNNIWLLYSNAKEFAK